MQVIGSEITGNPDRIGRYKVIFAGIAALIVSVGIARFSYTPMLHVMLEQAGLSKLAGGWLATLNYAGYMTGLLLVTRLKSDGQKFALYKLSLVIAVLTTLAMAWTHNVYLWGILRVLSGMSSVAGIILAAGFVFAWLKQNSYRVELGLHFSGLGIGIAITGLATLLMQGTLQWDLQWEMLAIIGLVFLLPAWCWMPLPDVQPHATHDALQVPLRNWLRNITLAYFCAGFGFVVSATFIVAILEAMPSLTGRGSLVWILVGLAAIAASFIWDRIARYCGDIRALIISFALQVLSIVIPATTSALIPNLIAAFLFGLTFTGIVSLMLTLVGKKYPGDASSAMARLTGSYGISQIIAPAIAGLLAARTQSYEGALWLAAGIMLIGIFALVRLKE